MPSLLQPASLRHAKSGTILGVQRPRRGKTADRHEKFDETLDVDHVAAYVPDRVCGAILHYRQSSYCRCIADEVSPTSITLLLPYVTVGFVTRDETRMVATLMASGSILLRRCVLDSIYEDFYYYLLSHWFGTRCLLKQGRCHFAHSIDITLLI